MIKKISYIFLFLLGLLIFRNLVNFDLVASGDFLEIENVNIIPYIWDWNLAIGGLGGVTLGFSWIHFILALPVFLLKPFGFSWILIQKIFYIYPLLLFLLLSPAFFFKKMFPKNNFYFIASLIYGLNTYILMLIGGGQIYVALAYSLFPIVLYSFISLFQKNKLAGIEKIKSSVLVGLLFTIQSMIDLRIAYVNLIAVVVFVLFTVRLDRLDIKTINKKIFTFLSSVFFVFGIPLTITGLFHSFWLIPMAQMRQNPLSNLGVIYSTAGAVKFFSFAKIENTISLLHPNWPENIFGKVYFMRPEFLILPILVFCSLLFINNLKSLQEKKYIIYFALLGFIGAFLAKGTNDPFGNIYIWMFEHVPGFMMFRDATKFYVLIALSYSILIPFTVLKTYEYLKSHSRLKTHDLRFMTKNRILNIQNLFILLLISYLLFLIRPAILGQLSGTFKPVSIPNDYIKLKDFFSSQETFFRTFWIPQHQRFGYYSSINPVISGKDFYNLTSPEDTVRKLKDKNSKISFQEMAVKYVIVPYDSEGEIFLKDREYDEGLYLKTIESVSEITWLKKLEGFGKIAVFEVSNPKDHFYINSQEATPLRQDFEGQVGNNQVQYEYINPTKYLVKVKNVKKGNLLVFSESFDQGWVIRNGVNVKSVEYNNFNSFILPRDGTYSFTVYYEPQKLVNVGLVVSSLTLTLILIFLGFGYLTKK